MNFLDQLSKDIGSFYLSEACADVYFLVKEERIPGHKAILRSRSEYFHVLFSENVGVSPKTEIHLPYLSAEPFKTILKFIYFGELSITSNKAFELLAVANLLRVVPVKNAISAYLIKNLSLNNIVEAINAACLYSINRLKKSCLNFVRNHIRDIINNQSFLLLSKSALELILQEHLFVPDNMLYDAIKGWLGLQEDKTQEFVSKCIENYCLSTENNEKNRRETLIMHIIQPYLVDLRRYFQDFKCPL